MGQRITVLVLAVAMIFLPTLASALGLGEITLKSSLNEPLVAEIKLLQVRDLGADEILVGLGTTEDFARIGVDRPYFLTDIQFSVELGAAGGPVVKVQSRKPVREPYLNFIVQAQWPSGKLLREFTLLLDLPVFSDSASPLAVQGSSASPSSSQSSTGSQQSSTGSRYNPRSSYEPEGSFNSRRPSEAQGASTPPALAGTDEYSVTTGDTLWEISSMVRPDRGVSIQQTMLAIQRINPEAFINNNINLLKKGQILRIPDREDIEQTSRQNAVQEVATQNRDWSGDSYDYGSSNVQLEGSRSYSDDDTSPTSREGRLKLSSPEDVADSYEGRASGSGDSSSTASLENELAITMELLDKTNRENSDLRTRLASLEEQVETMERLVEVSSEDLRAAELAALKNARESEAGEELDLSHIDEGTGDQDTGQTVDVGSEEPVDDTVDDTVEEIEKEAVEEVKPAPRVQAPKPYEKTIVQHILDNVIYIGIGLLVLVIAGFLFIRSRADDGFDDDDFLQEPFEEPKSEFDVEAALAEEAENLEDFDEPEPEPEPDPEPEQEKEESLAGAQTEDVVAEADIYIAYGKYDQAEDILNSALAAEPDNRDARLKLIEVYASQQDGDKFDLHFAKLHELGDADVIGRAEQLRAGIEGIDVFNADTLVGGENAGVEDDTTLTRESLEDSVAETEESLDFDLDLGEEDVIEPSTGESEDTFDLSLDDDLSVDELDLDLGDIAEDPEEESLESAFDLALDDETEDSGDLEFDLGDDDSVVDDLAIDLDSGEADDLDLDLDLGDLGDLDVAASEESDVDDLSLSDNELITDDLEQDMEPLEFDLGQGDTEVGSTPEISEGELSDFDLEFEPASEAETKSGESEFDLEFELGDGEEAAEGGATEFDIELSDEVVEDLSDTPELSLDDVSDDDLELTLSEGSEYQTLISPAITDADIADADDLELDGDLDLSALDQELDALTEMDVNIEPIPGAEPELASESGAELGLPEMEEPVVDFDSFEEELESSLPPSLEDVVDTVAASNPEKPVSEMGEDTMFDQAMNEVPPSSDVKFDLPEIDPEAEDDESDLGFLSDSDETATKLDLARAYIDMGDAEGAKDIINEILKEGNEQQRQEADSLLQKLH